MNLNHKHKNTMKIRIFNTIGVGTLIAEITDPKIIPAILEEAQRDGSVGISVHSHCWSGYITSRAEAEECANYHYRHIPEEDLVPTL